MNMRVLPNLDDYIEDITRLAHHHVKRLSRGGSLAQHEQEDLVQDLMVHIVKHWPELADNDFEPMGFAQLIITQKSSNELRRRRSQTAKFHAERLDTSEIVTSELMNTPAPKESEVPLDTTLAELPPEDRQFVELLMTEGPEQTALQLGISSRQVANRRERIGRCLEQLL